MYNCAREFSSATMNHTNRVKAKKSRWIGWLLLAGGLLVGASSAPGGSIDSPWSDHLWQADGGPGTNYVTGLAQTPDGYLWVSNLNGVSRFDGVKFENYFPKDFAGADNSHVRLMAARRDGGLWLILDGGFVVSLTPGKPPSIVARDLPQAQAQSALEDRQGALWIGYHNGPVCRIQDGKTTQFAAEMGVPSGNPTSLTLDNQGRLWMCKATHVCLFRDGHFVTMADVPSAATHLAGAAEGGIFVCSDVNLYKFEEGSRPVKLAS